MNEDMKTALFGTMIVAGAAVALILWQHALHTGQIIAQFGGASVSVGGDQAGQGTASQPASIAGTASPGQLNLVPTPTSVNAIQANANYQLAGETGPSFIPGGGPLGWAN